MDDLSSQLRDLHAPDPVSWWPPAPGWWIVAALLLAVSVWLLPRLRRAWRHRRLRRAIQAELEALRQTMSDDAAIAYLLAANQLLRRVALTLAPRATVAALHGTSWIDLLDTLAKTALPTEIRAALAEDCYRGRTTISVVTAHTALRHWVDDLHPPRRAARTP